MSLPALEFTTFSVSNPTFGGIVVDKLRREVSVDGQPVRLTPRELALLEYFIERAGRLLTRDQIVQEVWGERYHGGPRTVDIHISRLRRKLGLDLPLDTLRRSGYRFGSRG
jgi:two-component system, OmpR family, alkaline phosphatase synthesis response regulator PhoP